MPSLEFEELEPGVHKMIILKGKSVAERVETPWCQQTIDRIIDTHFPGCDQGWTAVSLMVPGRSVAPHTDRADAATKRVHVPLIEDTDCMFITDDGAEHSMARGRAYVIDPSIPHSVEHRGARDRIHLIFNVRGN